MKFADFLCSVFRFEKRKGWSMTDWRGFETDIASGSVPNNRHCLYLRFGFRKREGWCDGVCDGVRPK